MKLIINDNNEILFKVSRNITNEQIKREIQYTIENSSYKKAIKFINWLDEIEYHTGFSINLRKYNDDIYDNDIIEIYGDNGLIELQIIELDTIKEL